MRRYLYAALVAVVLSCSMPADAENAISITVRPTVATVKSDARLKVLLAPNEMNRALIWEVDGPNYYRSSGIELDGASSPRSYHFTLRDLPAGSFEVRATVRRNDNSVAVDRSGLRVVGGGAD